MISQVTNH